MKKHFLKVICVAFFFIVFACNKKKLTEVVEVPLPSAEEKITMGIPDDVKACLLYTSDAADDIL
jgi:Fe-Mn family superoxide dismutase